MKNNLQFHFFLAALAVVAPLMATAQTTFFQDTFTNGSTLNAASPANATITNTAYEMVSSKAWNPNPPTLAANDLKFGIGATTSGSFEAEALFATNAVALVQPGDYIQLTVVFTNTSGLLTEVGQLGFGLYNSGQVKPAGGGYNGTATTSTTGVTGGAQSWQGYVAQINYTGAASRIMTRPTQSETTGNNQDVITSGSGSSSYTGQATVGSTVTSSTTLTVGAAYTEVLTVTLVGPQSVLVTNQLYSGSDTNGTLLAGFGGVATNATYLTGAFDALAFGYRGGANSSANTMNVSSVEVSGSVTVITAPPTITTQPAPVLVATGGSCAMAVAADGVDVTYQWHRNGTNLLNAGNISGATSSQLVISPVGAADVASGNGNNGYWVTVTGAGPFSTNSVTNSLTIVTATNLTWTGAGGNTWDVGTTISWQDPSANPEVFTFGDAVTLDDTGGGGFVNLAGPYISPASVTVNSSLTYTIQGSGSIAGPCQLLYEGSGQLTLNAANTYGGGTVISNVASTVSTRIYLENYAGLGTGPVTFALAGGLLECVNSGSASSGINGDVIVNDDGAIQVDATSSFGAVFLGDLSGISGKTLTIDVGTGNTGVTRVRAYGANTVYNADLNLNSGNLLWATYQSSGSQTYNGVISGTGAMMQKGTITYFNGQNTYSGGMNISSGAIGLGVDSVGGPGSVTSGPIGTGPLLLTVDSTTSTTGSGEVLALNGARTIANAIQYPTGTNNLTLVVGGTNSITLSGAYTLNGNDSVTAASIVTRTIQVTNPAGTIISGAISDNSSSSGFPYGLVKTGIGALYLDGANTYTGSTTNNSNTTNAPGLLAGMGTIAGNVFIQTNSSIGGGSAGGIGTLSVGGNLTIAGNGYFRINRAGSAGDKVSVTGTIANAGAGTITVTNLGAPLQIGDTFTLFNEAVTGGGAMSITGGGMVWSNLLALNGTIQVLSAVTANYPTNVTFSLSGNTLNIGWPATHLGWILQAQTNAASAGLVTASNAWFDVAGTGTGTNAAVTINRTNPSVFYRLRHP